MIIFPSTYQSADAPSNPNAPPRCGSGFGTGADAVVGHWDSWYACWVVRAQPRRCWNCLGLVAWLYVLMRPHARSDTEVARIGWWTLVVCMHPSRADTQPLSTIAQSRLCGRAQPLARPCEVLRSLAHHCAFLHNLLRDLASPRVAVCILRRHFWRPHASPTCTACVHARRSP